MQPTRYELGDVVLRRPTADDAPAVAAAVQRSLDHLRPWMPWATDEYDEDTAREWVGWNEGGSEHAFVLLAAGGALLGATGLGGFDGLHRCASLGYWLVPEACGRGLATRATARVAVHGFDTLDLERIEIEMAVENVASAAVAERVGATLEGRKRRRLRLADAQHDAWLYSLVRAERDRLLALTG